jgi:hypothetical protein
VNIRSASAPLPITFAHNGLDAARKQEALACVYTAARRPRQIEAAVIMG